jgi:phage antirepressor YoqD-like protein
MAIKGIGRNKLFELLRDKGILMQNNQPYQKYIDAGYFRTIESSYTTPDGMTHVNIKTVVYQRGLDYIRKVVTNG